MAILGIDEVGRGPLAGPLVVGAVVLPEATLTVDDGKMNGKTVGGRPEWVEELRDSKKLSAKKRAALSEVIWREAIAGLGFVTPVEIDELGMSEALKLATRRAVTEVQKCIARKRASGRVRSDGADDEVSGGKIGFSQIVIDGKVNFLKGTALERYVSTAVKADDLIKEVSAASIVAKHARDTYMISVGERYSGYGFEKHMGYGTKAHMEALRELGPTPEHRRSFAPIAEMVGFVRPEQLHGASGDERGAKNKRQRNTTEVGQRGEEVTAEYLQTQGHRIVARNFKMYYYEIDIVSVCGGRLYFTEVKTRRDDVRGGGLAAVDGRKLAQMRYAAECYMKYHGWQGDATLAVAAVRYDAVTGVCEVEDFVPLGFS